MQTIETRQTNVVATEVRWLRRLVGAAVVLVAGLAISLMTAEPASAAGEYGDFYASRATCYRVGAENVAALNVAYAAGPPGASAPAWFQCKRVRVPTPPYAPRQYVWDLIVHP